MARAVSDVEAEFLTRWRQLGFPADLWEREVRIFPNRRHRFDMANREHRVLVELQGGTWSGGRHVRGRGYDEDSLKHNLATAAGWRVFRITGSMLRDAPEMHLAMIADALGVKQEDAA